MVYVSSGRVPMTPTQLFSGFVPKVEISKVVLSYNDRSGGLTPLLAEELFDNNPHIDVSDNPQGYTVRERRTDLSALRGSLSTRITVDLAIKIPQARSAFPSVFDEQEMRSALEVHVAMINNLQQFRDVAAATDSIDNSRPDTINRLIVFDDFNKIDTAIFEAGQVFDLYVAQVTFEPGSNFNIENFGIATVGLINPTKLILPSVGSTLTYERTNIYGRVDSLWVMENDLIISLAQAFVISSPPRVGEIWNGPVIRDGDSWKTVESEPRFLNRQTISVPKVQDFRIVDKLGTLILDFSIIENQIFPDLKKDLRGNRININSACTSFSDVFLSRDIKNNCRFFFSINQKQIILENSIFGGLFATADPAELQNLLDNTKIKSLKVWRKRIEGSSEIGSTPYNKTKNGSVFQPVCEPKVFDENEIPKLVVKGQDTGGGFVGDMVEITVPDLQGGSGAGQPLSPATIDDGGFDPLIPAPITTPSVSFATTVILQAFLEEEKWAGGMPALQDPSLRHFSGFDGTINEKTDGYYKYEIEIDMLDVSVKRISWLLEGAGSAGSYRGLLGFIKDLKLYYEHATRLKRAGGVPPWTSPYIDAGRPPWSNLPGEVEFEPGQVQIGSFDSKTNQFTQTFINDYTDGLDLRSDLKSTIVSVSGKQIEAPGFIQILEFFSKSQDWTAPFRTQITTALLDYLNPYTATPESINVVIQLMESVASRIDSILGVVYERGGTVNTVTQPEAEIVKRHTAAKNKTFKVKHESISFFNANLKRDLGFDFLTTTDVTQPWHNLAQGLFKIPVGYIEDQIALEADKFLVNVGTDFPAMDDQNGTPLYPPIPSNGRRGTYFTPHAINIPGSTLNMGNPIYLSSTDADDLLGVLAYSLCERTVEDGVTLTKLIERWILQSGGSWNTNVTQPNLLASDLAAYLALYHNVSLFSPENKILWQERAALINAGVDPGTGDKFYVGQRKNDQVERAAAYKFFMNIVGFLEFDEIQKKNIPGWHRPFNVNSYDIADLNQPSPLWEQFDLVAPDINDKTDLIREAPLPIKCLIYRAAASYVPNIIPWASTFETAIATATSGIQNPQSAPLTQYTLQVINKMEMLVGYETSTSGEILLNKPNWEALGDNLGKSGLCRSVPYENETYLLRRNKNYDLPTYDEYFIMEQN